MERLKDFVFRAAVRAAKALAVMVVLVLVALVLWWVLAAQDVVPTLGEAKAQLDSLLGGVGWKHVVATVVAVPLVGVLMVDLLDEWVGTGSYSHRDERWDDRNPR